MGCREGKNEGCMSETERHEESGGDRETKKVKFVIVRESERIMEEVGCRERRNEGCMSKTEQNGESGGDRETEK